MFLIDHSRTQAEQCFLIPSLQMQHLLDLIQRRKGPCYRPGALTLVYSVGIMP